MSSFIDMGTYGAYVWPSYGVAVVVMVGLWLVSLRGTRARERELKLLQELQPHRRNRRGGEAALPAEEKTRADA